MVDVRSGASGRLRPSIVAHQHGTSGLAAVSSHLTAPRRSRGRRRAPRGARRRAPQRHDRAGGRAPGPWQCGRTGPAAARVCWRLREPFLSGTSSTFDRPDDTRCREIGPLERPADPAAQRSPAVACRGWGARWPSPQGSLSWICCSRYKQAADRRQDVPSWRECSSPACPGQGSRRS